MKMTMTRIVKGRMRYYTLELIPNLFGEWILCRTYGSMRRLKPTRVIYETYEEKVPAHQAYEYWIEVKHKKGYL